MQYCGNNSKLDLIITDDHDQSRDNNSKDTSRKERDPAFNCESADSDDSGSNSDHITKRRTRYRCKNIVMEMNSSHRRDS